MSTYFLAEISPEQRERLGEAGVSYHLMTMGGAEGIVVPEADGNRALATLGIRSLGVRPTEYEGIVQIAWETIPVVIATRPAAPPTRTNQVIYHNPPPGATAFVELMKDAAQDILVPVVHRDVHIHGSYNRLAPPRDRDVDGIFHIWVWAAPYSEERAIAPATMWDHPVASTTESFSPADNVLDTYDDTDGLVSSEGDEVGMFVGNNNLYIYHNLESVPNSDAVAIFRDFLAQVENLYTDADEDDDYGEDDEPEDDDTDDEATTERTDRGVPSTVRVASWNGDVTSRPAVVRIISEILLPVLDQDIVVDVPHGNTRSPVHDGRFHVWVWSSPRLVRRLEPPMRLFGHEVDCLDQGFAATGDGIAICDETNDWVVAELLPGNLYIHHDLVHHGTPNELAIWRELLTRVLPHVTVTPEERAACDERARRVIIATGGAWESLSKARTFATLVRDVLAPVITDRSLVLHGMDGRVVPPLEDGSFHLWIWSAPSGIRDDVHEVVLWDIQLGVHQAFHPTDTGVAIRDENGVAVGELVGTNLYLNFAVQFELQGVEIFRRALAETARIMQLSPDDLAREPQRIRERSREAYVTACGKRFVRRKEVLEREAVGLDQRILRMQHELVADLRRVMLVRQELDHLKPTIAEDRERFATEFDRLVTLPNVRDVVIDSRRLTVLTDSLFCTDSRTSKRHEIGAFRIIFTLDGSDPHLVRWFNLTRRVDAYQTQMMAPHVYNDGRACLGTAAELFPRLIADYEYSAAVQMAIAFVESANVEDAAGRFVSRWPEAPATAPEGGVR